MKTVLGHLLIVVGLCTICLGADPFLGGGIDGEYGSFFMDGTAYTAKLTPGVVCTRNTNADATLNIAFNIYESDVNFEYDTGPDAGKDVRYDTCFFLDVAQYAADGTRSRVSSCDMSLNDATFGVNTDNVDERTWTKTTSFDTTATPTVPCGGRWFVGLTDDYYEFIVECKRDPDIDKLFDAAFLFACPESNTDHVIARQIDSNKVLVGDVSVVDVDRQLDVTFGTYKQTDPTTEDPGPKSLDANLVTTADLGDPLYFEVCISVTDLTSVFFNNGYSPIGVRVQNCKAKLSDGDYDATDPNFAAGIEKIIVNAAGCGTGSDLALQFKTTDYVFHYLGGDNVGTTNHDELRSPNCFRSNKFEAVSFQRKSIGSVIETTVTCDLKYCMSRTDSNCFGDGYSDGDGTDGYPSCTTRKRRSANDSMGNVPEYLPKQMSTTYNVIINGPGMSSPAAAVCSHDNTTFVIVTVVCAACILVVLAFAAFMFVKVRSALKEYRQMSLLSHQNKGYY